MSEKIKYELIIPKENKEGSSLTTVFLQFVN